MFKLKKHRHLLRSLMGIFVLLLFLTLTNPNKVGLGFLVVPALVTTFVTYELARYAFSIFSTENSSAKRQQAISSIIAIAVGFLLMLQSIGQLAAGDLAIIIFFVLISTFYASRFR